MSRVLRSQVDRQTFDRLMLDLLPAAQRFAIRLTGDPESADDVLQEALVRASGRWRSFRGESSFRTWLFRIAVNVWRDTIRRARTSFLPDEEPIDPSASPQGIAAANEMGRIVARQVSSLPPRQREVLILVAYEGMTPSEAGCVLGITEQNARVNLHLARTRLKQVLAPYLQPEKTEHG
jgi:RNA polymerase sigma-70 factor (ECF subfamily)